MKLDKSLAHDFDGLLVYEREPIVDQRGLFERMYCQEVLSELGLTESIAQINRSLTKSAGVVRGLHYQSPPHAETKIITCLEGQVYDVAVDLRPSSPTYLKYFGIHLSAKKSSTIVIPKGFAHGFQTQTDNCELLYFHTASYQSSSEGGINPFDSRLGIDWPLDVTLVSQRDSNLPYLNHNFLGLEL